MLVQFGNNWIQKIPLTAKLDSSDGLVQFWLSSEFFSSNFFQIGQHVILGTPTAHASKSDGEIAATLTVYSKIIFFDATIRSNSYLICTMHVKNIFPTD